MKFLKVFIVAAALFATATPSFACPFYIGCGCRAAIYVFGHDVRSLWPSQAWLRFSRTNAAPRMAAVRHAGSRRGHVVILESQVSGCVWNVTDFNRGKTYSATRSICGWTVVNPNS